ncbi:RHS repeat-associated core domain-containing protein [Chryseobacterium sp. P1-3]|uniref:RHS repeat-associated core domain-containing protein n=1 Tax=Chryseobacterium sp. (strain P1-3) TaxID=1517683 RepID=UPI000678B5FB|nr:RHS repeat-associated core domain-containing protein [Chryseobacterium sp. P1-3]
MQIGNGAIITDKNIIDNASLLIDRGYTSHEHFAEVGIIHMNGRLYDPLLRRFLNADENIQDPYNTQNYNKYGYVLNNPLMFNDPSGEFAWAAGFFLTYIAPIIWGVAVGTLISAGMYAIQALVMNSWSWNGFANALLMGAVTGGVSGGLGQVFSASGFWGSVGSSAFTGAGTGGVTALLTGKNFLEGVLKGAVIGGAVAGISYYGAKFFSTPVYSELTKAEYDALGIPDSGEALDPSIHTLRKMYKDTGWSEMKTGAKQFYVDHVSNGYTKRGDLYINAKGEEVIAYTRRNFWNGNTSSISFSKHAFGSKIKLGFVMNHELGHSVINLSSLNDYLQVKTQSGYEPEMLPKAYGLDKISIEHGAIWGIERDFLKLNGLDKLPGFFDSEKRDIF